MVENGEFKGKNFELIVEIFLRWQPFDEAITTAWMFCVSAGCVGELYIPTTQHNTEYAEFLLSKGYNAEEVMIVTGISKRTVGRVLENMQNPPKNATKNIAKLVKK